MAKEHRFMNAERAQGYSDAVYAIVITILIVPVANDVLNYDQNKTLLENLYNELPVFIIYICAFIFIYTIWEDHVWIFGAIENVADTVLLTNIVLLLSVSFLPYSVTLMTEFIEDPFAICLFVFCVVAASALEIVIIAVAFSRPKMLKEEIQDHEARTHLAGVMVCKSCVKIILSGTAAGLAFASMYASWSFLILLVFHDAISAICIGVYNYIKGFKVGLYRHQHFGKYLWHHLFEMKIEKERFTVFSDGVYAIVATLIILDLSSEAVPSSGSVGSDKTLPETLSEDQHMFLCYLASFVTVGLLWLNHQTVFHYISSVTRLMSCLNKGSLLFLGLLPFCYKLIAVYAGDTTDRTENYVVQINSACVFFASLFQILMYVAACRHSDKHFHDSHKGLAKAIVICKLLLMPIISLFAFLVCFKSDPVNADVISIITVSVIVLYAVLKIIMEVVHHHCRQKSERESSGQVDVDLKTQADGIDITVGGEQFNDSDLPAESSTNL